MVRDLERVQKSSKFPESAPAGEAVFYRTYSRRQSSGRESWQQVGDRILEGLVSLGKLTPSQAALTAKMQQQLKSLSSGRWLWVGGTQWLEKPENFSGAYNCTSTNVVDWRAFGLMMDLAMMGCGTGAVLEPKYINQLPAIRNHLSVELQGKIGTTPASLRREKTEININNNIVTIHVGDSRAGWVKSYQTLLELSSDERFTGDVIVQVVLDDIRGEGERLQGFGGVANPVKLPTLYDRCASILNKAIGRQLNSVECCLLIDEAAVVVVAGNVRRCLPGEALVHTESGLVPIQKIRIGDRVLTSKGFYPVTNFFDQGTQSLCRIKTQNGHFECTPDHKVAVLTDVYGNYEMVKAKNLTEGDRLIFVPKSIPGTATELPEFRQADSNSKAKPITIPALTTDVAYFLGYLHGDGSVAADGSRVRFRIAEHQPEIITRLVGVAQGFGLDTYTLRTPEQCKAKAFELQLNSSNLNRYLAQFKKSFTSISIPDCILLGTLDIRKAYLAGLADADGCHSQGVLVASVHQDFLRQVQAVYASLGITTRQCSSVGKRELVAVGHDAYESTLALLSKYSGYFSTTEIDRLKSSEDRRFSKVMVRSNVTDLTPIKVKSVEMDVRTSHTYDIEVSTIHEFVCEGILVSNSAGMRQGVSEDELFANAKGNLWHQDEHGNWRIDPERDALRMANHTRVFHRKPSLDECINAVRQQYYSGEGAIQWAGEAIARANADIVNTLELKKDFLKTYTNSEASAADWLLTRAPEMPATEVEHRLSRYALNPCVTADTWIHTEKGARQVKDLIGVQHGTYVNGELFSTTSSGFFFTGVKPVVKLATKEGYSLRLTENHQLLKITAQTQNSQYTEWVEAGELQIGDRISIHNHRELLPWDGKGTKDEGWLLGNLVGDGCFSHNPSNYSYQAHLRYWGDNQVEMKEYALGLIRKSVQSSNKLQGVYSKQHKYYQVSSAGLAGLARDYEITIKHKTITPEIEQASFDFYCGFLQGIFDADGSVQGTQNKGVSIRLAQSNLPLLEAVQRMLLRLGIASSIYQNRRVEGVRMLPDSNRELAEYFCQAQHELVIANDNIVIYQKLIGFTEPNKAERLQGLLSGYKRNINRERFSVTISSIESDGQEAVYDCTVPGVARFDANGLVAHNCGEVIGANFHCNLAEIHLNQINPHNYQEQKDAFTAGALSVASLLNHQFIEERYQSSRELDPIVGVSFTGLFDFFVNAFGTDWLRWWEAGRPQTKAGLEFKQQEEAYLSRWKAIVNEVVWQYCDEHNFKRPNRCTTVQPSGTKSLLTGASPGWHPPKAQRFIRRITFRKNDPVALACIDYGYNIVPSQSDKDENGNLLNNPFDDRCTEWLVEIPVAVPWADFPGADEIEISQFSAAAQMDFYMQVQKHYVAHNTSATIELREHEIESLGTRIYEAIRDDEGYISAALLARFDAHQTFPRLPFEPITKETYDQLMQEVKIRRQTDDFYAALSRYDSGEMTEAGPAGCDSDKCLFAAEEPK
jgi:intein/homing endonuclease